MQGLQEIISQTVTLLGYDLVDLEISNRGKLLRVFIDKLQPESVTDSVTIDDCVLVSNQLGNVLAVEHDIDYDRLEVSSPGMDRILKRAKDFERFIGERVQVKLRVPVETRKNFIGLLKQFSNEQLVLACDEGEFTFALGQIDKARLSPQFK